jgi:hypothetical protein
VDARRRQSWPGWQGAAARRATADNEHDRVKVGLRLNPQGRVSAGLSGQLGH